MYQYLIAQPSRLLTARGLITYPDAATQALTATEISTFQVTENAGEHLPLGGTSASVLSLKLDNRDGEWNAGGSILGAHTLDGAIVSLEIGVGHPSYDATPETIDGGEPDTVFVVDEFTDELADGGVPDTVFEDTIDGGGPQTFPAEYFWANVGTYVIEAAAGQEQNAVIDIKGSDYLANLAGTVFVDGLTYPQTLVQILTNACLQAGITLKSDTFINSTKSILAKPLWPENVTCRDIFGYISCCAAGFSRVDRDGLLEIIPFEDTSDYALTTARYKTLERQGAIFGAFNALSVYEYGAPNGTGATRIATDIDIVDNELNSIAVQGNPILGYGLATTDTIMTAMLAQLDGLTFAGGSISWQGDQSLTVGDLVTVTDISAGTAAILVLNQTIAFDVGFPMTSGNKLNSVTKGMAKTAYMRVFTPTGKLNAAALDGDINIKAGNNMNLLAGANLIIKVGGLFTIDSGNFDIDALGNVSLTGVLTANTGKIGGSSGFTIAAAKLYNGKATLTGTDAGVYVGTDGISLGSAGVAPQFKVTAAGTLTATAGTIGGFTIAGGQLYDTATSGAKLALFPVEGQIWIYDELVLASSSGSSVIQHQGIAANTFLVIDAGARSLSLQSALEVQVHDDLYVDDNCSALTFTDRTPAYIGDALSDLSTVKEKNGKIDHASLPEAARKKIKRTVKAGSNEEKVVEEDGRDLGMMISILTKAVQQLTAIVTDQQKQIDKLHGGA